MRKFLEILSEVVRIVTFQQVTSCGSVTPDDPYGRNVYKD